MLKGGLAAANAAVPSLFGQYPRGVAAAVAAAAARLVLLRLLLIRLRVVVVVAVAVGRLVLLVGAAGVGVVDRCLRAAANLARLRTRSSIDRCAPGRSLLPLRRKAWVKGVPSSGIEGAGFGVRSRMGGSGVGVVGGWGGLSGRSEVVGGPHS